MKYERLTKETVGSFGYGLKNFEHKPKEFNDYDAFYAYKMAVKRLGELEDKIESGEIISVIQSEQGEQEIAFFVEHNQIVRKTVIKQFAKDLKEKEQSIKVGNEWVAIITDKDIDELLHKRYSIRLEEEADDE